MSNTKSAILKLLEDNKGKSLSGNDIASLLSISRAAVWKAINLLKDEGYSITAINKKGYCLEEKSDILSAQSIIPHIDSTDFYNNIVVLKSVGSTNDEAKTLAHNGAKSGTVVIAEHQLSGKGRLGRSFYSPNARGIYMSVVFRLNNPIEQSMLITSGAAVAVCRAVKSVCNLDCQIKWVNDVYLDSKKLCGILTEASVNFEAGQLDYVVVGIGINVSTSDFSSELSLVAISLEEKLGFIISRSRLIGAVLNELHSIVGDLEKKSFMEEYKSHSFILGCKINVISHDKTESATAIDFNELGHLIVKLDSGEIKTLSSGEISIRKI